MSLSKSERQNKILDLIMKKEIGTQEELTEELEHAGFHTTQATVSRDIREMKLTKVALSDGRLRYVAYMETKEDLTEKYISIFKEGYLSVEVPSQEMTPLCVPFVRLMIPSLLWVDYLSY